MGERQSRLGRHPERVLMVAGLLVALLGGLAGLVLPSRSARQDHVAGSGVPPASAGPSRVATTDAKLVRSVRSGNWSDRRTWGPGVPGDRSLAVITEGTTVTADLDAARVAGIHVEAGASLVFAPTRRVGVESTANVVVDGTLQMRPASPAIVHTLRFTGVDESKFVGGGMRPLESDVGLWVTGDGRLDLEGSRKLGWTRLAGALGAGANRLELQQDPTGWQVGDEVSIAPTDKPSRNNPPDPAFNNFDERTITAVSGRTLTLNAPAGHAHPQVNNQWTAEVLNLTRNVRIEGTAKGRSHVFIHSSAPQHVDYVGIRYMGPRKRQDDDEFTDLIAGRYGLHFHMNEDADRGVVVQGVVVRDTASHAFVPHKSHGITFRDDISYNTTEDAFWWDQNPVSAGETPPEPLDFYETRDVVYDRDVAAKLYAIPAFRGYTQTGFNLGSGSNNTITNSVTVGNLGGSTASGFAWPASASAQPNAWRFDSNVAHNNAEDGLFVWQNTGYGPHLTDNFLAYHNGHCGIKHGAYGNSYIYRHPVLFENATCGIVTNAQSGLPQIPIIFDHPTVAGGRNAVLDDDHTGDPVTPVYLRDCSFTGQSEAKVEVNTSVDPQRLYFVRCGIEPRDIHISKARPGDLIRSQRADNTAFQVDYTGKVTATDPFDSQRPWAAPDGNRRPEVAVTIPRVGTQFTFADDLETTFSAQASDPDGKVKNVFFFVEGNLVGMAANPPYQVSASLRPFSNLGASVVTAVAIDDQGIPTISQPVSVRINQPDAAHQHG